MKDQIIKTKGGNFKMKTIDKRKNYYLTLDVETAGSFKQKLVYDLGFAIHDRKGNIIEERSFIIEEIFYNKDLMDTAYYKEKVPTYERDIVRGLHDVVPFDYARNVMLNMIEHYNPKFVMAYNLNFDMDALRKTAKHIMGLDKFLDNRAKGIVPKCIWSYACETLFKQKSFAKFAFENGLYSEAGNYKTSAEVAYAYMTGNASYEEEHTGMEDVRIEVEIFARCERQHKKHESGILSHPWRLVSKEHGKVVATQEG